MSACVQPDSGACGRSETFGWKARVRGLAHRYIPTWLHIPRKFTRPSHLGSVIAPNCLFSSRRGAARVGSIPIARSTFRWLTLAYVVLGRARAKLSVPTVSSRPRPAIEQTEIGAGNLPVTPGGIECAPTGHPRDRHSLTLPASGYARLAPQARWTTTGQLRPTHDRKGVSGRRQRSRWGTAERKHVARHQ